MIGAAAILGAFAANQAGWAGASRLSYQVANLVGAALLGVVAVANRSVGFVLLEATWVVVSLWGIARIVHTRWTSEEE